MADTDAVPPRRVGDEDMAMNDAASETADAPTPPSEPGLGAAVATDAKKADVKLEELFDDMESDDEFPSSRPTEKTETTAKGTNDVTSPSHTSTGSPINTPPSSDDMEVDDLGEDDFNVDDLKASDPEVMRTFYQRLFPWRYLFQWLNHSAVPTNDFRHREIAFTLANDAYLRYQSYPSADLLRKDVLRLMPTRFEIGPVYSTNPRDRKTLRNASAFKPISKELCFDIDLTDYDDVRTCCDAANICNKCWQFITMAIKVVDATIRDDFGFKHIMWVYSGRRGAHAWVCDRRARELDDRERRAIAGYLDVVRGGANSGKKVNLRRPLHPHIQRSLDILGTHFLKDVLEAQDPWASSEKAERLLGLLPDKSLNDSLRKRWDSSPGRSSALKWQDIDAVARTGASRTLDPRHLLEAKQDVVLEYAYPRLDIEVSKRLNHLLKSPFVVHPKTGRVCVPIDTRNLDEFDPLSVPTVQTLVREIDEWKEDKSVAAAEGKTMQDWEKTSLRPYIELFRSFVMALMRDEKGGKGRFAKDELDSADI